MYKKIIISSVLCIFSAGFVFCEWNRFNDISEKNIRLELFRKRAEDIKLDMINIYKSLNKLGEISKSIDDNYLKTKIKSSNISKIKVGKNSDYELVLSAKDEKNIVTDLQNLYLKSEGLLQFLDIKLKKQNSLIKAKVVCKFVPIDIAKFSEDIKICPQKIPLITTSLFKVPKLHTLLATMNNQQAFIDDEWRKIGDPIDENSKIMKINQYTIEVEKNGKVVLVHLGEKW